MKKFVSHIKNLSKKQKIIAFIALILLISGGILFFISTKKPEEKPAKTSAPKPAKKVEAPKPKEKFYATLSGAEVQEKSQTNSAIIGVMVENSPNARPQSGLAEAEVVFEAIAEGGITRFLALYQQNKPAQIGPVRSLRGYYLDWASGFQASIAHVGGSGDALARVRNGQHRDIDEFFNAGTFWRARDRWAPHNTYTNFENLSAINQAKGWTTSNFEGFSRKIDAKSEAPNASQISINFSSQLYNTSYSYNSDCNCYLRSLAGTPHNDREKGQIQPKNVVALKIPMSNDGYYNHYATVGSGAGYAFLDGKVEEISWSKAGEFSPLILKNSKGENLALNIGQTWFAAIPAVGGAVSWQ